MEVFVKVVEAGAFASAARALGLVPSAVSRIIARLESRLGVRLLRRSTRRLGLTAEGERYHHRSLVILADLDTAEREAAGASRPAGRVRINSSASYVTHVLRHILPTFLESYPDIALDIVQSDSVADLIADATDIAIRAGRLPSSELIARPLAASRIIAVAAPSWVERHGETKASQAHIGFTYPRAADIWLPSTGTRPERVRISDGEGMRQLAIAGIAPARLAEFTVRDDLAAGRLVRLPADDPSDDREAFHAVFVGPSRILPARVRVVLDYLAEHGRVS